METNKIHRKGLKVNGEVPDMYVRRNKDGHVIFRYVYHKLPNWYVEKLRSFIAVSSMPVTKCHALTETFKLNELTDRLFPTGDVEVRQPGYCISYVVKYTVGTNWGM